MKARQITILLSLGLLACVASAQLAPARVYRAEVVAVYPHDPNAFTQGLVIHQGRLYEGTGRNGESSLREVNLETGEILRRHNLANRYFGEGITVMGDAIYQLTWRENTGFIYDLETFATRGTFFLAGEGWGITNDDQHLIVSDGSAWLRFLDPDTQREVKRVQVRDEAGPVDRLNELEYIDGEVWANVWYEDYLVRIDPDSGRVNSRVDLSGLHPRRRSADDVLNGIAWDAAERRLFVTGKLWPNLYEIKVLEP